MNLKTSITLMLAACGTFLLQAAPPETSPMAPVTVEAREGGSSLNEGEPVGPYNQPEWTTHRRFSTTRVYLQRTPWEVGFEQWWRVRTYEEAKTRHLFIEELEIGLPYRFQLDLYYDWIHEKGETEFKDFAVELRWALADWGVIPLNPTLYAEYKLTDGDIGSDVYEVKLLLGDEITDRLHWGMNFVFEREIEGEEQANEFAVTQGISYTIIDQVLSAGVEMQYKYENVKGARDDGENKFQVGPSIQWRPTANTHLDLVALFGCTDESPEVETFVVFGIDFGGPSKKKEHQEYKPVSGTRL